MKVSILIKRIALAKPIEKWYKFDVHMYYLNLISLKLYKHNLSMLASCSHSRF